MPELSDLTDDRVRLRRLRLTDAAAIAEGCADPDIVRFTYMPSGLSETEAEEYVRRREAQWADGNFVVAITEADAEVFCGQFGVRVLHELDRAELFYWLLPRARGRGLVSAALEAATRWCFDEHAVVRAQLIIHPDNAASAHVAEAAGYQREGLLRAWTRFSDGTRDAVMWSRLRSDGAQR